MPLIRDLHNLDEEAADKKREREQEKLARAIKTKITHLQHKKQRMEQDIRALEKKVEALHKKGRTVLIWWYSRKLRIKKIKLDALNKITPSAKF